MIFRNFSLIHGIIRYAAIIHKFFIKSPGTGAGLIDKISRYLYNACQEGKRIYDSCMRITPATTPEQYSMEGENEFYE